MATDNGTPPLAAAVDFTWTITSATQPIAYAATYETLQGRPLNIVLTGTHPTGEPISYTVVTQPASGALTGTAPDLVFTPESAAVGTDSFTFTVTDGTQTSPPATVIITITPPATSPLKAGVVADITSLQSTAIPDIAEPTTLSRTLVLMARATTTSISSMGIPLILLGLLSGSMLTFGRIAIVAGTRRGDIATGIVRLYDPDNHYGLIAPDDPGPDVFFHHTDVRPKHGTNLATGDRVQYRTTARVHRDVATAVRLQPTTQEKSTTA